MDRHTDLMPSPAKVVYSGNIQMTQGKVLLFFFFQMLMSLANSKLTNTGHYHSQITEQDFNPHI